MFLEIANHLWQSTLFVLLIAAVCRLFRHDGAHVRYWLWWAASVKFLVPFSLLTALGAALAERASVSLVPEAWTNSVTVVARPFVNGPGLWSFGAALVAIWAAGFLFVAGRWGLRALRLGRIVRAAAKESAPVSLPLVDCKAIAVYRAQAPVEPGVIGVLRSSLLLPAGLEGRLSPAQFEAVVAHELCHIRRRDNLTAAVHMLVETVFWFHPLVWWVGARLIDERERACDEMVVALGHDRETYAESILDVCEHYVASPLRCAAGISGSDLKRRITQIMRYQGMNHLMLTKKLFLGAAALGLLAIPFVAGLTIQTSAMAQESQQPPQSAGSDQSAQGPAVRVGDPQEYLPLVKVAPIYPPRAAARGLEGYVVLRYTVTANGSVEDVEVVESSATVFERAAIESAQKYKYRPRVIDGTPISVPGVTTKIVFQLAGGDITVDPASEPQAADPASGPQAGRSEQQPGNIALASAEQIFVTGRPRAAN